MPARKVRAKGVDRNDDSAPEFLRRSWPRLAAGKRVPDRPFRVSFNVHSRWNSGHDHLQRYDAAGSLVQGVSGNSEQFTWLQQEAPRLVDALKGSFRATRLDLDEFFYWSKESFGLKPVVSITHVMILRTEGLSRSPPLSSDSMQSLRRAYSLRGGGREVRRYHDCRASGLFSEATGRG